MTLYDDLFPPNPQKDPNISDIVPNNQTYKVIFDLHNGFETVCT